MLDLLLTADMPWPTILWVILVDWLMIACGLVGPIAISKVSLIDPIHEFCYFGGTVILTLTALVCGFAISMRNPQFLEDFREKRRGD